MKQPDITGTVRVTFDPATDENPNECSTPTSDRTAALDAEITTRTQILGEKRAEAVDAEELIAAHARIEAILTRGAYAARREVLDAERALVAAIDERTRLST